MSQFCQLYCALFCSPSCLIRFRMSSARHAVQRLEIFTGLGKRPVFTPSHQHVLPMGITDKTSANRTNPISGIVNCITNLQKEMSDLRPMRTSPQCFNSSADTPPSSILTSIDSINAAVASVGFAQRFGSNSWMKSAMWLPMAKIIFCKF
jgi:hypothetical protein